MKHCPKCHAEIANDQTDCGKHSISHAIAIAEHSVGHALQVAEQIRKLTGANTEAVNGVPVVDVPDEALHTATEF